MQNIDHPGPKLAGMLGRHLERFFEGNCGKRTGSKESVCYVLVKVSQHRLRLAGSQHFSKYAQLQGIRELKLDQRGDHERKFDIGRDSDDSAGVGVR